MNKIKVFISQPMKGLTKDEILTQRNNVINKLKKDEYYEHKIEIIDSYFEDYNPNNGCIPLKYLSKSLELMADADAVLFIGKWFEYRGCKIEHECAKEYGLNIVYEEKRY